MCKSFAKDNILPHLFYTNVKIITHNKNIYENTPSDTFRFLAKEIHGNTCLISYYL
jgi:hypothetical protein